MEFSPFLNHEEHQEARTINKGLSEFLFVLLASFGVTAKSMRSEENAKTKAKLNLAIISVALRHAGESRHPEGSCGILDSGVCMKVHLVIPAQAGIQAVFSLMIPAKSMPE